MINMMLQSSLQHSTVNPFWPNHLLNRLQVHHNGLPRFLGTLFYTLSTHPLLGADEVSGGSCGSSSLLFVMKVMVLRLCEQLS